MSAPRIFFGRMIWPLIALIMVLGAVWILRYPLLRATGNFLISTDALRPSKALYVLGGSAIDRGTAAAQLLRADLAPVAWCMGELVPTSLEAYGIMVNEGELTAGVMLKARALPEQVKVIPAGTSTMDESIAILEHAQLNGYDSITVVTTEFHSRRVGRVFRSPFKRNGIVVLVHGAPSSRYDAQHWWSSEEGLLMVNNEYMKLIYYLLKY